MSEIIIYCVIFSSPVLDIEVSEEAILDDEGAPACRSSRKRHQINQNIERITLFLNQATGIMFTVENFTGAIKILGRTVTEELSPFVFAQEIIYLRALLANFYKHFIRRLQRMIYALL